MYLLGKESQPNLHARCSSYWEVRQMLLDEYAESIVKRLEEVKPNGLPPERLSITCGGSAQYAQGYCDLMAHNKVIRTDGNGIFFYVQQPILAV